MLQLPQWAPVLGILLTVYGIVYAGAAVACARGNYQRTLTYRRARVLWIRYGVTHVC